MNHDNHSVNRYGHYGPSSTASDSIQGANKAMSDTLFATLKNPYTELLKVLRVHDNNVNNLNDLNDHRLSNTNPQLSKKELIEKLATVDRALAQYAKSGAVFHDWLPALGDWLRDLVASSDNDPLSSPGSVEVSSNIQPQGQTASNSTNPGPAAQDGSDERIEIAPHSAIKPHTPRKPHAQVQLGGFTHTDMDMHDLIGYLNIGEFQDRARLRSSPRSELTSAQAHHHEDGVYSHPDLHIDREIINIPFLRPISTKHRSTGFERVQPRHHQVDTAALQLARGFSGDERLNRVDTFILADEPGLGKTWTLSSYHAVTSYMQDAAGSEILCRRHLCLARRRSSKHRVLGVNQIRQYPNRHAEPYPECSRNDPQPSIWQAG
jgi:hypothetical protein